MSALRDADTTVPIGETLKAGDTVNITIKGARVADFRVSGTRLYFLVGDHCTSLPLDNEHVTIERVEPPAWPDGPPQPGDVYRDASGKTWVCIGRDDDDPPYLFSLDSNAQTIYDHAYNDAWKTRGPFVLLVRDGQVVTS